MAKITYSKAQIGQAKWLLTLCVPAKKVAELTGISPSAVNSIKAGRTYKSASSEPPIRIIQELGLPLGDMGDTLPKNPQGNFPAPLKVTPKQKARSVAKKVVKKSAPSKEVSDTLSKKKGKVDFATIRRANKKGKNNDE